MSVLSRFNAGRPTVPPVPIGTLASGFVQAIDRWDVPAPVMFNQDPTLGIFAFGNPIPSVMIGAGLRVQYIRADTPSGIVGGGLFGPGAIGYRVAFHGKLIPHVVGGFTVYEPELGGDQRK